MKKCFFSIFACIALSLFVTACALPSDTPKEKEEIISYSHFFTDGMILFEETCKIPFNVFLLKVPSTSTETSARSGNQEPIEDNSGVLTSPAANSVGEDELREIESLLSEFQVINQRPLYPTGCEAISAVMVMRYLGINISPSTFVDQHLEKSYDFYFNESNYYGPDPKEFFVGDPRREKYSFGCFAPVIEKALKSALPDEYEVLNETGTSLSILCENYIDRGIPVIVWTTSQMVNVVYQNHWYTEKGELFAWPANEHCSVLIGYDDEYYYFADSYYEGVLRFKKDLAERRFSELGSQALVVSLNKNHENYINLYEHRLLFKKIVL